MPRFHIHIFNDVDAIDEDGMELPDLAEAKRQAIRGGRSMMADHLIAGEPIKLFHRIEIADESGEVLAVITFRELITIEE
jgi:hypothetical protein